MTGASDANSLETPGLLRRLAAFAYEGVLLFGVVMVVALLYGVITQQRHALAGQHGLQAVLFAVLGLYFVWFWSHGGQTLAMKTWHVRLVSRDGAPVRPLRALARYVASWVWFAPALLAVRWAGIDSRIGMFGAVALGVCGYAALALLHPRRQFWHDVLCGTRLANRRPVRGQNRRP